MRIQELELRDFRNLEHAELYFDPGVTVFVGSNGQGKTNILESIEYVATGSSHRVSSDVPLVRFGCDHAITRGTFRSGTRESTVEIKILTDGSNVIRLNKRDARRREFAGRFPVVLFAPTDLALVKGDPAERRTFLNQLLVLTRPAMAATLAQYERTVKQRNTLLKSARQFRLRDSQLDTLETWNRALAAAGAEIVAARQAIVNDLNPIVRELYGHLVDQPSSTQLTVQSTVAGAVTDRDAIRDWSVAEWHEAFIAELAVQQPLELDRGVTLVGPHRDDLILELNGLPARTHASHGESWSYALALRLAMAEIVRDISDVGDPILMLDDVFAELDIDRRRRLAGMVAPFEQVLISAAIGQDVPAELTGARFAVRSGVVTADA